MTFTDLTFLFIFLPIALLLYHLAAAKFQEGILLILSLFFYACGSREYFLLLILSLLINITAGQILYRNREKKLLSGILLTAGILFNAALLGYYKYFDFAIENVNRIWGSSFEVRNLLLPLGLSFYTFKAVSYLLDVYKNKIKGNSPMTEALYLSFFGQIQSGPIARYGTFEKQEEKRSFYPKGVTRFLIGFCKKILLSNVLSNIVVEIFDNTSQISTLMAWGGAVCFSLQLYYDFSGYSDMALGICAMFGYDCPENFCYPYAAKSISEFWRRWHITLGSWFRDYIYIPMGGSRKGKLRLYRNLLVVWLLTGLWHGAAWNFVAWGLGYFILIALEKVFRLPERLKSRFWQNFYRIPVLLLIIFQWVMFRSSGFRAGISYIKTMLVPTSFEIADARTRFLLRDYRVFLVAAVIFAVPVIPALKWLCEKKKGTQLAFQAGSGIALVLLFVCALAFVVSGQNNPFLYANF